jgi:hypothetical protein
MDSNQLGRTQSEPPYMLAETPEPRAQVWGVAKETPRSEPGMPFQPSAIIANDGPGSEYWLP